MVLGSYYRALQKAGLISAIRTRHYSGSLNSLISHIEDMQIFAFGYSADYYGCSFCGPSKNRTGDFSNHCDQCNTKQDGRVTKRLHEDCWIKSEIVDAVEKIYLQFSVAVELEFSKIYKPSSSVDTENPSPHDAPSTDTGSGQMIQNNLRVDSDTDSESDSARE